MPDKKLTLGLLIIFFALIYFVSRQIAPYPPENISKFHTLTQDSPLLYDGQADAALLREKNNQLEEKNKKITELNKKYIGESGEYTDIFSEKWSLWPIGFLKILPEIHDATKDFLENPDSKNAKKLLDLYNQASREYKKAVNLNIEALEKTLKSNPDLKDKKVLFLGSATTPNIVLEDFKLILKNAGEIENEIKKRENCLQKGECKAKEKTEQPEAKIIQIPFKPISDKILGIEPDQNKFGPFWSDTNCFGFNPEGADSYPFFLIEKRARNNKIIINPMLTNTKHYRNYELIPDQSIAQMWLREDVKIRPHSGLNDYLCTDLRYIPKIYSQYLSEESKNMLATLPYLISHTLSTTDSVIYELNYRKKPMNPLYLLINRSAYSLYFGTFSDAIWLLDQKPQFLISGDFSEESKQAGYVTYQDLKESGMTDNEIAKLNSLPRIGSLYKKGGQLIK